MLLVYCKSIMCFVPRSVPQMRALRNRLRKRWKTKGNAKEALKVARNLGVNLHFDNPWHPNKSEEWVFGPDVLDDNVYRCLPQCTLHGMDEGLTSKLNHGVLLYALAEVGNNKAILLTNMSVNVHTPSTF